MSERHPETTPIEVDFVADLACPWCFLGLVRLDRARALRPDFPIHLRWRPFLLNPQMPPEGMDRATYVRRKFGGNATEVYRRLEESGCADGVAFAFDRMPRTPNTTRAHRLILFAEERGAADAVIRALFRALFQEGRDVGRPEVLAAIAEEAGLDGDEVGCVPCGRSPRARRRGRAPAGRARRDPRRAGVHRRSRACDHRRAAARGAGRPARRGNRGATCAGCAIVGPVRRVQRWQPPT